MKNNDVAILDFGSQKISCFVASPLEEGFVIKASGQSKYGGYANGDWLEAEKLGDAVAFALSQAEQSYGAKIKSVYVGVPGEFTIVTTGEASCKYHFKKKVNEDDLTEIFNRANIFGNNKGATPINRSSIYYIVNDDNKTIDPMGMVAKKLTGLISYIYMTETFRKPIAKILSSLKLEVLEYVSANLAQALFLLPKQQRDRYAVLLDIGYISSSVMLVGGDGLIFMKSFSLGSGHIAGDLCQVMKTQFSVAEQLLDSINLNLDFMSGDFYTLKSGVEVLAQRSNEVVKARIDEIAKYIIKCFDECDFVIPPETPVYITGGGLNYTKGAVEYLSTVLSKRVQIIRPQDPANNRHELTSCYGLLELGAKQTSHVKKGFFSIFKK